MIKEERSFIGKTRKWARWSIVIAANAALLLVVGISTVRESYQGWKVDKEIRDLQTQVQHLEGKRNQLSTLIDTLHTSPNLDLEARMRLGMQKPGEQVVILQGFRASADAQTEAEARAQSEKMVRPRSNPEKWFAYFISHEPL